MRGLAILFAFQLAGVALQHWASVPLPGSVIGLILLLCGLLLGWVKLEWIEQTASWLLKHMMLFFAPFIVGTMVFFPFIADAWLPIGASLLLGTLSVVLVTGATAKLWSARSER